MTNSGLKEKGKKIKKNMLLYLNQFLKVELLTIFIFIYFKELCWLYLSLSQYVVRSIPCITLSSSSSRQCWTTLYSGTHTGTYVINVIRLSFSRSTQTAFFFFLPLLPFSLCRKYCSVITAALPGILLITFYPLVMPADASLYNPDQ